MKNIVLMLAVLLLISCNSESVPEVQDNNEISNDSVALVSNADTTTVDSVLIQPAKIIYTLTVDDKKALSKYITKTEIKSLEIAIDSYSNTDLDTAVISSFLKILQITDTLKERIIAKADYNYEDKNGDYYPFTLQTELAGLEKSIPGFTNSCVAECTVYDCIFEILVFKNRAILTSGIADDEFFEILNIIETDYLTTDHQFRAWFSPKWDYGGASWLGSGIHKDYLKKSQDFVSKNKIGSDLLGKFQMEAYEDLFHGIYMNSAESVAKELEEIYNLKLFSDHENKKLIELHDKIVAKEFEYHKGVGKILQFDCATGDCNYGG